MPTANIYNSDEAFQDSLVTFTPKLQQLLANELTCGERRLSPGEISVRLLLVNGHSMIAPIEIDITAHAYGDKVPRADKVCITVREFIRKHIPAAKDVRVSTHGSYES